jgi:hypothetical protein
MSGFTARCSRPWREGAGDGSDTREAGMEGGAGGGGDGRRREGAGDGSGVQEASQGRRRVKMEKAAAIELQRHINAHVLI